ncbi:tyrosine-type recombinase/integrase [Albidovulum sediminicola]|uniref:Tyrosine-type recombinase/integrase n=1 Tax=Albidovulum sediminicola TaxID=2984331 RepID=A0ABT2Z6V8_9RHOB|nr:tyrosine-type recombinase/integrase [Defluviimonas sp. WL0075]MCV2866506.1 tyrosine-type recombinase/integrase [Defluviimonas sp. WL0075]
MARVDLKGIHRVRKRLVTGAVVTYHYAYRGGPQFWKSTSEVKQGTPDYLEAFIRASKPQLLAAVPSRGDRNSTSSVIARYRDSVHFKKLGDRTKADYEKYLLSFEKEFGSDPIAMFEERDALAEINAWKNKWSHSPKQFDYATSVVTRLLNWARDTDVSIQVHHHVDVERMYSSNRADIVWLPGELRAMLDVATERESRIVIAASEGGLTPQDIGILTWNHVQKTPKGRRLFFKRTKTGNPVSIPVTPALATLIDTTPKEQKYLIVSLEGRKLTSHRASQITRDVKDRANAAAEKHPEKVHIRNELRLYDMRGTAATELLRAGCSLNEIAVTMGWGLRHAANIIEKYAAVVPEVADEVFAKLMSARKHAQEGE